MDHALASPCGVAAVHRECMTDHEACAGAAKPLPRRPALANALAVARPMPDAALVTSATLLLKEGFTKAFPLIVT
jgi:hypothetical protein